MSTGHTPAPHGESADDNVAAQPPIAVHNCNRLGRSANPPYPSLADWLLMRRRR